ncbi:MAG: hypothetical protein JXK05_09730 [Campylobacterales bacterium]|nr:hypothetical protein [Campylobacterales bacterium]
MDEEVDSITDELMLEDAGFVPGADIELTDEEDELDSDDVDGSCSGVLDRLEFDENKVSLPAIELIGVLEEIEFEPPPLPPPPPQFTSMTILITLNANVSLYFNYYSLVLDGTDYCKCFMLIILSY